MDILGAIKQREIEHQREHDEFGSTLESCLPGGCDKRDGDIPTLIQMVESLTFKLKIERRGTS